MTLEQRTRAARAFWETEATDDQLQAVLLIAQQKKFRPKTVVGLDIDRKARHLATLGTLPDQIAARALVVYHLAEQRPMMAAFLDALGIAHENGLIQEDSVKPDPEKIAPAAAELVETVSRRRRAALPDHARVPGPRDLGLARRDGEDNAGGQLIRGVYLDTEDTRDTKNKP